LLQSLHDFKTTSVNKPLTIFHDIARKMPVALDALGVAVVDVEP